MYSYLYLHISQYSALYVTNVQQVFVGRIMSNYDMSFDDPTVHSEKVVEKYTTCETEK